MSADFDEAEGERSRRHFEALASSTRKRARCVEKAAHLDGAGELGHIHGGLVRRAIVRRVQIHDGAWPPGELKVVLTGE